MALICVQRLTAPRGDTEQPLGCQRFHAGLHRRGGHHRATTTQLLLNTSAAKKTEVGYLAGLPVVVAKYAVVLLRRKTALTCASACAIAALAAPALAQEARVELRGGAGVGAMLSRNQRDLGFGTTFVPDLHPGLRFDSSWVAELAIASWIFPVDEGSSGRATLLGIGARFDPRLTEKLSLFVDAHAGLGLTGSNNRFMYDAGAGLEYLISSLFGIGPFVRYGQISDSRVDPKFIAGGVQLAVQWPGESSPGGAGRIASTAQPAPRAVTPPASAAAAVAPPRAAAPPPAPAPAPRLALRDQDNDGVADSDDRCPAEPRGPNPDPQREGCPDADDDKDGVANGVDKCRDQAVGLYPDPVSMGCPLADRDKDSVPDLYDSCPDKPGSPDSEARRNGCPGLIQIEHGMIKLAKPVQFGEQNDVIARASLNVLKSLATALRSTPAIKKILIEGHTDAQGDPSQNLEMSKRRAESVRRWLSENGVEGERLQAAGYGDTKPIATNRTAKGRAENRRIEIVILDPAPGGEGVKP
jgi:outer membrane protein OmpA-like peptidoglycan-associated protein